MDESPSTQKATNSKKITTPPVESSINQRPRRTIKHKFIKCNRDSPEKATDVLVETVETDAKIDDGAEAARTVSDTSTSKAIKSKLKHQQKNRTEKSSRRSCRQNRSKDNVSDLDDSSNLQMVEIIDDPSDDPNVSIEEIIETCVLDEQEYQRMMTSVSTDKSSETSSDQSDSSKKSADGAKWPTSSCDKQISVGLVDCMKRRNMLKHLIEEESTVDNKRKNSSSSDDSQEKEKIYKKSTTEVFTPIRTRRVTRLSSISPRFLLDTKLDDPKHSSPKNKVEGVELVEIKTSELQTEIVIEKFENVPALENTVKQIEVSREKIENDNTAVASSADCEPILIEKIEATDENKKEEPKITDHKDPIETSDVVETSKKADTIAEEKMEPVHSEIRLDDCSLPPVWTEKAEPVPSEPTKIFEESECKNRLAIEEKTKEKSKVKKEKKRTSERDGSRLKREDKSIKSDGATGNLSSEVNKKDLHSTPEKKSDPTKQMQPTIADGSTQKPETIGEALQIEKDEALQIEKGEALQIEKGETLKIENGDAVKIEKGEALKIETGETLKIGKIEASKIEKGEASKIEKGEVSKIEKSEASEIEKGEAVKIEKDETVKIEKVEASKIEKVEASKIEKVEASKIEKVEASKIEKVEASKIEKGEAVKVEKVEALKIEKGDAVKIEKNKKKKESHSDKDSKSKRTSDSSRKSDGHSTHKSSSSKSSEKKSKETKPAESKTKHNLTEEELQTKKSHKRDSCNRSEKEIAMEQLKAIEQKALNRSKVTSNCQHSQKETPEKSRDSTGKPKIKPTSDTTKVKSKAKETASTDQSSSKVSSDHASANRKGQQPTAAASRTSSKSNRCGTDFILSECYLPKQVKYDESLYSIEALKAAQAAQEEQMKVDAEAARKAKEILAAKEEQAKAARAAARLARIEEAKAEKAKAEAEKIAKAEAEKAMKQARAAAKASRSKIKENLNRSNDSPRIDNFGLCSFKSESQEPPASSPNVATPRESTNQDFIPENFKNSLEFVQYQSLEHEISEIVIRSEEAALLGDEEETNIRRSGRIKTITETKQRACGFGLVKDKDKFHSMYVGDLSYSSMSDSQYMSDYNSSSNSNSMLDLSEIEKDLEMEPIVVKREKTAEELEMERLDVAEGLSLFKQIIDCEYRSERTISKETKKMTCDCFLTKSEIERGELGCGEDCLNRLIFIECGSRCAIGDRCTNKRFQKHKNSDCTIFKAGKKGFGMKAASVIEAGEFIMEYVGEVLNSKQFDERRFKYSGDNIQHHYFMALRSDCVIDATTKGNISRFINHSCDPNAETQKWTVNGELRIGFFSTRTIQPDEEITFDYQFQRYGKEAQKCYCEAANCRGWIGEEPDSDDEEEEDEDEEEYEEVEEEEECEEEEQPTEEKEVTPIVNEITAPETTIADNLIEPLNVKLEDNNETPKVEEKPVVPATPSPTKKIRKPKLEPKPKKYKIKKSEIMEDPDLDHEIANLMTTSLKNQAHTLCFSRLIMRAKMLNARTKLLGILRNGEIACRRLFLDYHGLKLLHTWMCDPITSNVQRDWAFRLDILETLEVLPIPNKNMLQDSKVLAIVKKWANTKSNKENVKSPEDQSPSDSGSGTPISEGSSPEDSKIADSVKVETNEQVKCEDGDDSLKKTVDSLEVIDSSKEVVEVSDSSKQITDSVPVNDPLKEVSKSLDAAESDDREIGEVDQSKLKSSEECADDELMEQIHFMTTKLLERWEVLKEVFRIPKKLRIEQMKEHEQEANRSYRALGIADSEDSNKRYTDVPKDKERFKKGKRHRPKDSNDPDSVLLKVQRRRLFEAQMAQESIDKRNYERQLEAIHIAKCKYFQLDPRTTSYRDVPFSVSPLTGQWYSKENEMIATPPSHAHIKPPQELTTNPDEYDIPPMDLPPQWKFAIDSRGKLYYYHVKIRIPQWEPPIKILPLREEQTQRVDDMKMEVCDDSEIDAKDDSLFHSNLSNDLDSDRDDDSEESSDAVDSSEDELMQKRQQLLNSFQSNQTDLDISANLAVEISAMATTSSMDDTTDQSFNLDLSVLHTSGKRKNRDGLATERLISPRTEEERLQSKVEMQRYKANKEKFRRRRENAKLRQHGLLEPSRKLKKLTEGLPVVSQQDDEMDETDDEEEASVNELEVGILEGKFVDELDSIKADKVSSRSDSQKIRLDALRSNRKVPKKKRNEPEPVSYNSNEAAKRIKEKFCAEMSGVIVQHLGPYRRDDCKIGRITNNEDFKHLARKLTHFVMLKELKHCDNTVTVLEVTDSVRAKSKEFIRKYMAKFGEVYVKPENEPEYKEFCNT